ncbi:hypothetical protein QLQ12_40665 [Actinoplanes sp. NEAU-A12]|uniref:ESX-1 secretion-associated protein n=1 Tax=Actinoplanes sandaracinus TaxID=3045177 RepID=A0ABT6WYV0_9ACTN|nr:hypothetical protein [Actinoplanes sandaracinus]MDI6104918.1 hypothetical protein [Actinoplanes sandaracinus]
MAEELAVDLVALETISGRLTWSANALDDIGRTVPAMPDAGDVSGIIGAAMGHLTESAANLALGMMGAGEQADAARRTYAARNQAAADSLRGY